MNGQMTEKQMMRKELLSCREQIFSLDGKAFSLEISKNLLRLATYRYADGYLMYSPIKSEVDISSEIERLILKGKKVYLPRCLKGEDGMMEFCRITSLDDLEKGAFGVMEPVLRCPVERSFSVNTVCIVPGVGYDKKGFRIGYGKGYYDRFLRNFKGMKIGVVFSELILEDIPKNRFDAHVDVLVSEKGVMMTSD